MDGLLQNLCFCFSWKCNMVAELCSDWLNKKKNLLETVGQIDSVGMFIELSCSNFLCQLD